MYKPSKNARRLSNKERYQYRNDGYLTGLPVFSSEALDDLHSFFVSLSSQLNKSIDLNQTAQWQKASLVFYKLCTTPQILNYVEDLLGPNFFLWGGQFFLKEPIRSDRFKMSRVHYFVTCHVSFNVMFRVFLI